MDFGENEDKWGSAISRWWRTLALPKPASLHPHPSIGMRYFECAAYSAQIPWRIGARRRPEDAPECTRVQCMAAARCVI